jgi:maltooligosyltrehalose trehalohydrolase
MTGPSERQPTTSLPNHRRRLPIGAERLDAGRTHFRVWAPAASHVAVIAEPRDGPVSTMLSDEGNGYFSGVANVPAGGRYRYQLNNAQTLYPDPASRYQPEGPHGPSVVVDPAAFTWSDAAWPGITRTGQVV